ncbi:PHD finger protein 20-like protein 1 isoform X3 [Anguilla rostrata]|uniref:PHD finger protein 20-like protein 1 isoform X3 n=1 Tax=Anguilla rostrata TaxID=7938 RepID=UPI0030CD8794
MERLSEMSASCPVENPACTESTEDQTELLQSRQDLSSGEEVLARWTDCRYYPAKIQSVHKEGTYTVQFYDGVVRCMKRMHIKSMPEDVKGQDWIALVRAATSAAKRKQCPGAEGNKDKRDGRSGDEAETPPSDEASGNEEADSAGKSATLRSVGEGEVKSSSDVPDETKAKRERAKLGSSLTPRRALLTKLRVSVAKKEDESVFKEEKGNAPGTHEEGACVVTEGHRKAGVLQRSPATARTGAGGQPEQGGAQAVGGRRQPAATPATEAARPTPGHTAPPIAGPDSALPFVEKPEPPMSPRVHVSTAFPPPPPQPPITGRAKQTEWALSSQAPLGGKVTPPTAADLKGAARTPKLNKHSREPIMNTIKLEDPTSPHDLDHNKFKCQVLGCSKAFRKAKLLDYHLKYYHNADKEAEPEAGSPSRAARTRTTSASTPCATQLEAPGNKRRRCASTSASVSPPEHLLPPDCGGVRLKPPKFGKMKRSSASMSLEGTEDSLLPPLPPRNKSFESLHDKILKKVIDKDHLPDSGLIRLEKKVKLEEKCQTAEPIDAFLVSAYFTGKKKEKDRERKEKKERDPFKMKPKKKKKKKKKCKQHSYAGLQDGPLSFLERGSSPLSRASSGTFTIRSGGAPCRRTPFQYPRAILSVDLTGENLSDAEFLEDSSTESLLLSGDEYGQDLDSLTMEDFQEEADAAEIVRCICQTQEENGFMIQCEECMCWQHSACMGLPEDRLPEQYSCYICRDPPGQRWSAKYRHDKDWLNRGHLYGLSFLPENYSHQNAKKIVSAHQLLADVFSVKEVLHGLQLKMGVLQNKHNPNLHLWAQSWVNLDEDQPMGGRPARVFWQERLADEPGHHANPDAYIASEHSYQKPTGLGPPPWPSPHQLGMEGEEVPDTEADAPTTRAERTAVGVPGCAAAAAAANPSDSSEQARNRLQWKTNLLAHIEDVQNQVALRMDLIERELDVLESWLDFTGELEPPDPLARLPQLKLRIKRLLTDLAKVQQMSTLCSV